MSGELTSGPTQTMVGSYYLLVANYKELMELAVHTCNICGTRCYELPQLVFLTFLLSVHRNASRIIIIMHRRLIHTRMKNRMKMILKLND